MTPILKRRKIQECPYCKGKFEPHRAGQLFCTAAHQKAWHKERAQMLEAQLEQERERWNVERDALVREIAELRKELEREDERKC